MKRFFFLVCVVLCLSTSCEKHPGPKTPDFQIMDANWNDTLRVAGTFLVSKSFEFHVGLKLQASLDEPFVYGLNPRTVFLDDYAEHYHKPAELFAIEKIRERSEPLWEFYKTLPYGHFRMSNVYVRDTPTVYADKTLFGKEPGADLSSFFVLHQGGMFKCSGPDYKVIDGNAPLNIPLVEFFSEGTMMPFEFSLESPDLKDELFEDDNFILTFVFPVTVEHYWARLMESYDNPEAEESFSDMDMVAVVNLKGIIARSAWLF